MCREYSSGKKASNSHKCRKYSIVPTCVASMFPTHGTADFGCVEKSCVARVPHRE